MLFDVVRLHLQLLDSSIANDPCYGGRIFYGEPQRHQQALSLLRLMRRKGYVPLAKVPHILLDEVEQLEAESDSDIAADSADSSGGYAQQTAAIVTALTSELIAPTSASPSREPSTSLNDSQPQQQLSMTPTTSETAATQQTVDKTIQDENKILNNYNHSSSSSSSSSSTNAVTVFVGKCRYNLL